MHDEDVERAVHDLHLPEADAAFLAGLHQRLQAKLRPPVPAGAPQPWRLWLNLGLAAAVVTLLLLGPGSWGRSPVETLPSVADVDTVRNVYSQTALRIRTISSDPLIEKMQSRRQEHGELDDERGAEPSHDRRAVDSPDRTIALLWRHVRGAQPGR